MTDYTPTLKFLIAQRDVLAKLAYEYLAKGDDAMANLLTRDINRIEKTVSELYPNYKVEV